MSLEGPFIMRKVTNAMLILAVLASMSLWSGLCQAGFFFNGVDGAPAPGSIIDFKLQDFEVVLDATAPPLTGDPVVDAAIVAAHKVPGGLITTPGQQLYGIFNITSIQSP